VQDVVRIVRKAANDTQYRDSAVLVTLKAPSAMALSKKWSTSRCV
jgi:hypothetical protein